MVKWPKIHLKTHCIWHRISEKRALLQCVGALLKQVGVLSNKLGTLPSWICMLSSIDLFYSFC